MRDAVSLRTGRRTVGVVLLATVVALALVLAIGASANKASAATKLVTKSFSNTTQITIPDDPSYYTSGPAFPYPSNITASFPNGSTVKDVDVILRHYSHTYPDDVDVLLVHAGRNRTIMSDVGGSNDVNDITIRLNDEPTHGHLSDSGSLFSGGFLPTNTEGGDTFDSPAPNPASANSALSGFDGSTAKGSWKLFVDDDRSSNVGRIGGGWIIIVQARVPV
jgi:subtilisin-like proprotein convertase family protein